MQTQFVDRVSCLVIAFQRIKGESHSTSRRRSQSLPSLIQTHYINSSVIVSAEVFPCAEELERWTVSPVTPSLSAPRRSLALKSLEMDSLASDSVTVNSELLHSAEELERHQHLRSLRVGRCHRLSSSTDCGGQFLSGNRGNSVHRQSGAVLLSPPCRKLAFLKQQCCLDIFGGLITES